MTPIILVDELVKFIKPVVAEFVLQTNQQGVTKAPQVLAGFLDEKKPPMAGQQGSPDFPFVIVRYLEDDDTEDSNIATIRIYAGTYSLDAQNGWRDAMNVITRIKQALLKQRIIGKQFWVEKPMKTEMPEDQPFPEWVAVLSFNMVIPQVEQEGVMFDDGF